MTTGHSKALCHPDRPMQAKGLCSACYGRYRRWVYSDKVNDLKDIIKKWEEIKSNRIKENAEKRLEKKNKKRKGKEWRFKTLKQRYGLNEKQYNDLLESQNSACAICEESYDVLYVDHCHTTNEVRGLLCPRCNTLVGYIEKSGHLIQKAKEFLVTFEERGIGNDDRHRPS